LKATDVNAEVSALWKSMSAEDQIEATDDVVEALKERREAKALAPHHVPLHAFHDTRANIESVEKEVIFPLMFLLYNPLITLSLVNIAPCTYWNRDPAHCREVLR
jgi:hypothetical protein